MNRKTLLLTVLLILALTFTACGTAVEKDIIKNDNSKTSAATEAVNSDTSTKSESAEAAKQDTVANSADSSQSTSSAAKEQTWNGESPDMSRKWTAYYVSNLDYNTEDQVFVLYIDHNFYNGNGYLEVQYGHCSIYDGHIDYGNIRPMSYASFSEEGGINWFQDYSLMAGPEDMPALDGRAGLIFSGQTIQFGWCDDNDNPDYFTMYLLDCSYY